MLFFIQIFLDIRFNKSHKKKDIRFNKSHIRYIRFNKSHKKEILEKVEKYQVT